MVVPLALVTFVSFLVAWFVRTGPFPPIHEDMTSEAANLFAPADLPDLVEGVRRPDVGGALTDHVIPGEQKRHALRRWLWSSTSSALDEVIAHLLDVHSRMLDAPVRSERLKLTGEALHLIQDSFSPAHSSRNGLAIEKLRNYGPINTTLGLLVLTEHVFPVDPRDNGRRLDGTFTSEASDAILASRAYLRIVLRHTRGPRPDESTVERDIRAYAAAWLSR